MLARSRARLITPSRRSRPLLRSTKHPYVHFEGEPEPCLPPFDPLPCLSRKELLIRSMIRSIEYSDLPRDVFFYEVVDELGKALEREVARGVDYDMCAALSPWDLECRIYDV